MSTEIEITCPKCEGTMIEYTEKGKGGWFFSIQVCQDCGCENDFEHSSGDRPEDLI